MNGLASAYAILGLDPGADATTVEQTYKRLIKRYHPDRPGGDAARAAEINQAYRELRRSRTLKDPLELNEVLPSHMVKPGGRLFFAFGGLALLAALLLFTGPGQAFRDRYLPIAASHPSSGDKHWVRRDADALDDPLHASIIDSAIADAVWMIRNRDEMALAERSQACHSKLRERPETKQLDRCAAFDDAVVHLQDRDPYQDRGPFSTLSVTRRQWAAASQLSEDSLAIDTRLRRIGLRVELALSPPLPAPPENETEPAD